MRSHCVLRCPTAGCLGAFVLAGHAAPAATSHKFLNFNNETHLTAVNVLPAWNEGLSGAPVTVAVVDSGVDLTHADLAGSFADGGGVRSDDFTSHGTLVSGLITGNFNAAGSVGIAYDAKVLPIKAFDGFFGGSIEVLQAIDYAASRGEVRIINLSLGRPLLGQLEISTVQSATAWHFPRRRQDCACPGSPADRAVAPPSKTTRPGGQVLAPARRIAVGFSARSRCAHRPLVSPTLNIVFDSVGRVPQRMDRHKRISFTQRSLNLEPDGHEIDVDVF